MYLEYKMKEKWNKKEGVLSGGTILERFSQMEKRVENP
jgi:hypothetical protein